MTLSVRPVAVRKHAVVFPRAIASGLRRRLHHTHAELKRRLKSAAEVLVEVAVDDGVHAAVEEGQPVSEREDVDGHQVQLSGRQIPVVRQHHEDPERQPGHGEQQGHHQQHVDHPQLPAENPAALVLRVRVSDGGGRFDQLDGDACVHDDDERDRSQVDVREQDGGVDLPHAPVGPGLPAGVQGVRDVVPVHHEVQDVLGDGQSDGRGAHDGDGQSPDEGDGDDGLTLRQLPLERIHDATKPRREGMEVI